jgi:hypothetical protein
MTDTSHLRLLEQEGFVQLSPEQMEAEREQADEAAREVWPWASLSLLVASERAWYYRDSFGVTYRAWKDPERRPPAP